MTSGSTPSNIGRRLLNQTLHTVRLLTNRLGVHTSNYLRAAGFIYTGNGDTTRCVDCGLEISDWTRDMVPFTIHAQRSPRCPFVNDVRTSLIVPPTVASNAIGATPVVRETTVCESATSVKSNSSSNNLVESEQLKQTRVRSFSHWSRRPGPSARQMINAGLFCCNNEDRVICIYCNLLCQRWTSDTDDPCIVHKKLSPDCCYVKEFLTSRGPPPTINNNCRLTISVAGKPPLVSNNINSLMVDGTIRLTSQNNSSQTDRMGSIDDAIQGNYFTTDAITAGVCLVCGGAFRNFNEGENPMIDHARRYPNCPYVQQLQGVAVYRPSRSTLIEDQRTPPAWTEERITQMVAARLDWPMSRAALDRNYSLSIVKKCWEDQLRLKRVDFVSDLDLKVACLIQQKQVEHSRAQEPVIIAHERMRQMRENEIRAQEEILEQIRATANSTDAQDQSPDLGLIDTCTVCLSLKKHVAFLPCGHLVTCVQCSDHVHICPVCRGLKAAIALVRS